MTARISRDLEDRIVQVCVLAAALVVSVLYVLTQSSGDFLYLMSNGLPPILAVAAVSMAVLGLGKNRMRTGDRVSRIWLGYAAGITFWFLGEFTWAIYTLWFGIPIPFPSPADGFWLVGYIPLLVAILMQAWPLREVFSSTKMRLIIAVAFVFAVLLLIALIPGTYASELGEGSVALIVALAYPLLDVILLVVAVPILVLFRRGTFWRPFFFVIFGLMLTTIGDILFTWATLNGVYYDGSYLELFYHWAYLAFAYGFYLRFRRATSDNMLG